MAKEIWSLKKGKDQKVTLRSIVKKKIEFDHKSSTLGSSQRINSYIKMTNEDHVYQYLGYIWSQNMKNSKNQNSRESFEPEDKLKEEILEMIRENDLTSLS